MIARSLAIHGYRGTRGDVLMALKQSQPLTAGQLAVQFGVTANALRRHLKELEIEGIVCYRREIHGVGGPVFAYSLTETGERLFPRSYESVLTEVLELVRAQFGSDGVSMLFRKRWEEIAERVKPELALLPLNERARRLAELLTSLGYMAEATGGSMATLREHNCTIRELVVRFPEICAAEERFIRDVLGADVTRQAHIAKGANCCEYCIQSTGALGTGASDASMGPIDAPRPAVATSPQEIS